MHTPHRLRMIVAAMNAVPKVAQAGVQILAVLVPRNPIDTRGSILAEALVRLLQKRLLDMAQQIGEPFPFPLLCSLSDPLQGRERACPVLSPERVSWSRFPVGRALSLHRLDGRYPRLRRLLAGRYSARVRLLEGLLRITAVAFPPVPAVYHRPAGPFEVSRFPCMRPM
jgi:hypothetical protein